VRVCVCVCACVRVRVRACARAHVFAGVRACMRTALFVCDIPAPAPPHICPRRRRPAAGPQPAAAGARTTPTTPPPLTPPHTPSHPPPRVPVSLEYAVGRRGDAVYGPEVVRRQPRHELRQQRGPPGGGARACACVLCACTRFDTLTQLNSPAYAHHNYRSQTHPSPISHTSASARPPTRRPLPTPPPKTHAPRKQAPPPRAPCASPPPHRAGKSWPDMIASASLSCARTSGGVLSISPVSSWRIWSCSVLLGGRRGDVKKTIWRREVVKEGGTRGARPLRRRPGLRPRAPGPRRRRRRRPTPADPGRPRRGGRRGAPARAPGAAPWPPAAAAPPARPPRLFRVWDGQRPGLLRHLGGHLGRDEGACVEMG
jgi:hypothetical protein